MRSKRLFATTVALFLGLTASTGFGDDPKSKPKKPTIMQQKLAASQKILEGLAQNDFTLIKENSEKLNDLSKMAAWKLIETPRYENYSEEFQRLTLKMAAQAKE